MDRFRHYVLLAFTPVFFLSTGLHTNSSEAFTALLLMAVASTMLTVPMVPGRLRGARAHLQGGLS